MSVWGGWQGMMWVLLSLVCGRSAQRSAASLES